MFAPCRPSECANGRVKNKEKEEKKCLKKEGNFFLEGLHLHSVAPETITQRSSPPGLEDSVVFGKSAVVVCVGGEVYNAHVLVSLCGA